MVGLVHRETGGGGGGLPDVLVRSRPDGGTSELVDTLLSQMSGTSRDDFIWRDFRGIAVPIVLDDY
jgi:hypothetical protein